MGTYKIRDIETLTGIKAHTLRIWEKRYGILSPERTETKIRTYSDDDLASILNIALLNKEGWKISKIAKLPFQQIEKKVKELVLEPSSSLVSEKLVLALVEMDEELFRSTLQQMISEVGFKITMIDFIYPFLKRIGVMWTTKSINTVQEHFISNLLRETLIVETSQLPQPKNEQTACLFLREGEWHEIGLLFYNYLLRENGVKTFYLGQSVPVESLLDTIKLMQPDVLVSSFVTTINENSIQEMLIKIRTHTKARIIFGGSGVDNIADIKMENFHMIKNLDQFEELISL